MKTRHLLIALGLLLAAVFQASAASNDGPSISAAELSSDLDQWLEWMGNTHPDLSYSVDAQQLEGKIQTIKSELKGPMSRRDAWKTVARVNPLLNDGHLGIRYPVEDYQAYLESGGKAFPLAVVVTANNQLHTAAALDKIPANTLIRQINGENADAIVAAMMQRARGQWHSLSRNSHSLKRTGWSGRIT